MAAPCLSMLELQCSSTDPCLLKLDGLPAQNGTARCRCAAPGTCAPARQPARHGWQSSACRACRHCGHRPARRAACERWALMGDGSAKPWHCRSAHLGAGLSPPSELPSRMHLQLELGWFTAPPSLVAQADFQRRHIKAAADVGTRRLHGGNGTLAAWRAPQTEVRWAISMHRSSGRYPCSSFHRL